MATDQSKLCSITNNSGKDIILAVAISPDETSGSNAVKAANGQLEVLTLSGGGTVLKNGQSGTVTLDHSYQSDCFGKGDVLDYDLVACDTNWLYPLALLSVEQQTVNSAAGYALQTVTKDMLTAMSQALSFYQVTAAYPGSQLAKDYITALQKAKNDLLAKADGSFDSANAAAEAISEAVNYFFKSTKDYQQVTHAALIAIDNYYNAFPSVWAQYENEMTYYLYGSDGKVNAFAGILSLKKPGALDLTKVNGGYACSFIPAVDPSNNDQTDVNTKKTVALTYAKGLFLDNPDAAKPAIALKGSFLLRRQFTGESDDNSIVSVVNGMINGLQCIGLDTAQSGSEPVQQSLSLTKTDVGTTIVNTWDKLKSPKSRNEWIISVVSFTGGAVLALGAIGGAAYGIYRYVKYKARVKEPLVKETVASKYKEISINQETGRIKWMGPDNSFKEVNTDGALAMIESAVEIADGVAVKMVLGMTFTFQRYCVEEALKYSSIMDNATKIDLQGLLTSTRQSERAVSTLFGDDFIKNNHDPQAIAENFTRLKQEATNFTMNQASFETIYKNIETNLALDAKEFIDINMNNTAQIFEQMSEIENREEVEESEMDPNIKEEIKPPMEEIIP